MQGSADAVLIDGNHFALVRSPAPEHVLVVKDLVSLNEFLPVLALCSASVLGQVHLRRGFQGIGNGKVALIRIKFHRTQHNHAQGYGYAKADGEVFEKRFVLRRGLVATLHCLGIFC